MFPDMMSRIFCTRRTFNSINWRIILEAPWTGILKMDLRPMLPFQVELEWCIVDERQFKTAKRLVTPQCSETVFFRDNFVIFRRRSKRIDFFWNQWIFLPVSICKFSNIVMVTWPLFGTIQGLYQMSGHSLSRLAKGTPSESRFSSGTIGLGQNCLL